jgi:hypothetical protein
LDKIGSKPGAIGQKFSITPRRGFLLNNTKKIAPTGYLKEQQMGAPYHFARITSKVLGS